MVNNRENEENDFNISGIQQLLEKAQMYQILGVYLRAVFYFNYSWFW